MASKQEGRTRLAAIVASSPSPTVRKFYLIKVFASLLPQNAKELCAADIERLIRNKLS